MDAGPRTLAIDIGATGLKAGLLDTDGHLITPRVRQIPQRNAHPA